MNVSTASTLVPTQQASPWYLVHRKLRQDERAEESLLRQGYGRYRPQQNRERIVRDRMKIVVESFFPGYLFVQLAADANWAPLRTTTIAEPVFEVGTACSITAGGFAELDASLWPWRARNA